MLIRRETTMLTNDGIFTGALPCVVRPHWVVPQNFAAATATGRIMAIIFVIWIKLKNLSIKYQAHIWVPLMNQSYILGILKQAGFYYEKTCTIPTYFFDACLAHRKNRMKEQQFKNNKICWFPRWVRPKYSQFHFMTHWIYNYFL